MIINLQLTLFVNSKRDVISSLLGHVMYCRAQIQNGGRQLLRKKLCMLSIR